MLRQIAIALVALSFAAAPANAQPNAANQPPTISVTGSGSISYVPDISRITVGIRVESGSAQDAVNSLNQRAQQVIAALHALGISDRNIQTTSYNLQYREPPQPMPGLAAPPTVSSTETIARAPLGGYVAMETLQVTTSIAQSGKTLDAAIQAGANESFGLSYQTSNADALYRQALAKAVQQAHDAATVIAQAAHLSIVGVESISTTAPAGVAPEPFMARSMAIVTPGTEAIAATVYVVYKVR